MHGIALFTYWWEKDHNMMMRNNKVMPVPYVGRNKLNACVNINNRFICLRDNAVKHDTATTR